MAPAKCPKCSEQVEQQTPDCPKCGFKIKQYFLNLENLKKENEKKAKQYHAKIKQIKREKEQQAKQAKHEQEKKLTKCAACNYTLSKRAVVCPMCGDPQDNVFKKTTPQENQDSPSLLDFQFKGFITPQLVKIIYALTLILGGVSIIGVIFASVSSGNLKMIIPSIFAYAMTVLFTRVVCESALILFKIEENSRG